MSNTDKDLRFATAAVRAGYRRTNEAEHGEAIFTTSSFVFDSAAEAAAIFAGERTGNIYSRFTNPTVQAFERRLAVLEGGDSCVATASGMAAILATCLGLLRQGDHIVCARDVFGSTTLLLSNIIGRFGIHTSFVELTDLAAWRDAIRPNTRLLFMESPSNPLLRVGDISALAGLAHDNDALLAVDNCLCTPALQRPLELGADLVIHSATKYIDGQGRAMGGAIVGDAERVGKDIYSIVRTAGPSMSPFNAWVFLKGLETLAIRMAEHSRQAMALAQWLQEQGAVTAVHYTGLTDHPEHALSVAQQSAPGGVLSFSVVGGRDAAWRVIDATQMLSITANLGDTRSTITHPATTTHGRLSDAQRAEAGIDEGLIRIAVGLEDLSDIKADLARGLA